MPTFSGESDGDDSAVAMAALGVEVRELQRQIRELRAQNASLRLKALRRAEAAAAVHRSDVEVQPEVEPEPPVQPAPAQPEPVAVEEDVVVETEPQSVEPPVELVASPEPNPLPWLDRPPRPKRKWERYVSYSAPTPSASSDTVTPLRALPAASTDDPPPSLGA